jgi:6-phosphogluconolactonase
MYDNVYIFDNPKLQAEALANKFQDMIVEKVQKQNRINIAVSGGSTPQLFFDTLAESYSRLPWEKIHIFWVDERCVPPADPESNYGMTRKSLLDKVDIPELNLHRIFGEADPEIEAMRYAEEINLNVKSNNAWPIFDWILLGLGEDGHIGSLFPNSPLLENTKSLSAVAIHPQTKQKRITLTLPVLNHALRITFLVSGISKAQIIKNIFASEKTHSDIPARLVKPESGIIEWYLDKSAAERIT